VSWVGGGAGLANGGEWEEVRGGGGGASWSGWGGWGGLTSSREAFWRGRRGRGVSWRGP